MCEWRLLSLRSPRSFHAAVRPQALDAIGAASTLAAPTPSSDRGAGAAGAACAVGAAMDVLGCPRATPLRFDDDGTLERAVPLHALALPRDAARGAAAAAAAATGGRSGDPWAKLCDGYAADGRGDDGVVVCAGAERAASDTAAAGAAAADADACCARVRVPSRRERVGAEIELQARRACFFVLRNRNASRTARGARFVSAKPESGTVCVCVRMHACDTLIERGMRRDASREHHRARRCLSTQRGHGATSRARRCAALLAASSGRPASSSRARSGPATRCGARSSAVSAAAAVAVVARSAATRTRRAAHCACSRWDPGVVSCHVRIGRLNDSM